MELYTKTLYCCPVCHLPLNDSLKTFVCPNNHLYDKAKEGYVNLLLANQKASKDPGDVKSMLVARREFLETGAYAKLVNKIQEIIAQYGINKNTNFLDIGSGEGYYTNIIADAFKITNAYGIDISRDAVLMAAKKYSGINFAVASAERLPFADSSFDLILSIFSPLNFTEAARVLTQKGIIVFVGPGPKHMQELASKIYSSAQIHRAIEVNPNDLKVKDNVEISFKIKTNQNKIINAWKMSPYFWHSPLGTEVKLRELTGFTADFNISIYNKTAQ